MYIQCYVLTEHVDQCIFNVICLQNMLDAHNCRETVRSRFGIFHAAVAASRVKVHRGRNLPHRSLSREGDGSESTYPQVSK